MTSTELLTLKEGDDYFRISEMSPQRCSMSKATVYPLDKIDEARTALELLHKQGIKGRIMKLTITEDEFPLL